MRSKLRSDMMRYVFEKDCSSDIVEERFGKMATLWGQDVFRISENRQV